MTDAPDFDLDAYLARVGYDGAREPSLPVLEALHVAHLGSIPFENVDVFLGRPVRIDLDSIHGQLVRGRRGGYCFQHNTLFAAVLRALGFEVATLEARVRPEGSTSILPRTHMVLRVEVCGRAWMADVGFGGDGPLLPVPLDGTPREQLDGTYAIEREGDGTRVLRRRRRGACRDLYAFTLSPALPIDFEVAHHYTSTHPESRFVTTLTVQRVEAETRRVLRGRTYTVRQGEREVVREIPDEELPALLKDDLGLDLPGDLVRLLLEKT